MSKDYLASLPDVVAHYKDYNLLLPTSTDVQLNPFYKYHVEEVPVDLEANTGDIFKVGTVKIANTWVETFALSKPLLNKLAMAAGIQFNPAETYGKRIDKLTYRAQAQGGMRKADGTSRTETDQKVICLEDEEEKYRIEFTDKAEKGIVDEKQAKAAAEIFKGKWVPGKDKFGNTTDRNGAQIMAYLIDECDRGRYIERSVMVNMALLKKTWAEKAMTGAKLRVIRALLGLKGTYTKEELKKSFAIPAVVFSPDYTDPDVRSAMLVQGMNSVNNMFGSMPLPVKKVEFDEGEAFDVSEYENNAAFQSDSPDEDLADDYRHPEAADNIPDSEPQHLEPQHPVQRQEEDRSVDYQCSKCGAIVSEKVYEYSIDKFGEPLCVKCQRGGGK